MKWGSTKEFDVVYEERKIKFRMGLESIWDEPKSVRPFKVRSDGTVEKLKFFVWLRTFIADRINVFSSILSI